MNIKEELTKQVIVKISQTLDSILKTGLAKKGYVFTNNTELENFIKSNCKVEVYKNEKTFYVNGKQFLKYYPDNKMTITNTLDGIKIKTNVGYFKYV